MIQDINKVPRCTVIARRQVHTNRLSDIKGNLRNVSQSVDVAYTRYTCEQRMHVFPTEPSEQ